MKKKKKRLKGKISIDDYIKAVKKADREIQLSRSPGFIRTTQIHTSKKIYSRKNNNKNYSEE